jgi:carboxymethylenebutenolidase
LSNEAFEALAPVFVSRGWVLFAPYRRGQGLSESAAPYILDEAAKAAHSGGDDGWNDTVLRILAGDHLDDQIAALRWLRQQPFVQEDRVAVAGNSFGGIEVVFGAEREAYCAAVDSAGAAQSWKQSPQLQERMKTATRNAKHRSSSFKLKTITTFHRAKYSPLK